jgi:hypothetical protein
MFSVTALTLTRRRFLNRLKPDAPEKPFYQCTVLTQACRFYDIVTPILWPSKRAPARGYLPVTVSQIHSRERAYKPLHASSKIPSDPVSSLAEMAKIDTTPFSPVLHITPVTISQSVYLLTLGSVL